MSNICSSNGLCEVTSSSLPLTFITSSANVISTLPAQYAVPLPPGYTMVEIPKPLDNAYSGLDFGLHCVGIAAIILAASVLLHVTGVVNPLVMWLRSKLSAGRDQ